MRDGFGVVSVSDAEQSFTTPIVSLDSPVTSLQLERTQETSANAGAGGVGVVFTGASESGFGDFEIRENPVIGADRELQRKLYDARGVYRGELSGAPGWENFGKRKLILLDAYRPERLPYPRDWVLVLEAKKSLPQLCGTESQLGSLPIRKLPCTDTGN
jgi:hypothetical protein